ncbi:MAG TPA: Gfo/Idh/MocA family oxidoreductase, partial [Bacteroidales bacterium]|nr:Gfo/Idh/MocA family oxidoreductase [Bacteroidales bacterium]
MVKIGVLGAGHLGKIHIKCIRDIKNFELVGFHDADVKTASNVKSEFGLYHFENIEELIDS